MALFQIWKLLPGNHFIAIVEKTRSGFATVEMRYAAEGCPGSLRFYTVLSVYAVTKEVLEIKIERGTYLK